MAAGRTGSTAMLIAYSRKITTAIARPIVRIGKPLDLSSNHTCALVADVVGHGNRNSDTSQSGCPPDRSCRGTTATESPRRCRATPTTVRANETTPIRIITAFPVIESSTCGGDPTFCWSKRNNGAKTTNDPTHWTILFGVDHWMQV